MSDRGRTTTSPVRRRSEPSENGSRAGVLSPPRRRVRLPELAIGVLVTVGCALGAVLWHLRSVDRIPVLATAAPIARGETIDALDLRVVYISAQDEVASVGRSEAATLVGRVAAVDLAAGTLLTPGLVDSALVIDPGAGVVGLALEPGQFPTRGLVPGDAVTVVAPSDSATEAGEAVLAERATVFAIEELSSDRLLVSLLMDRADATVVAAAAAGSPLRLVLVAT